MLRAKLATQEFAFPGETEFKYEPIWAYRCIERMKNDNTQIKADDFLSNIEASIQKGKKIKKKRGQTTEPENDIYYYGTSLFKQKEIVEILMHFPKPNKKICSGYVHMEGGPQATEDQHINWWLYEDADLSCFNIEKGENNE